MTPDIIIIGAGVAGLSAAAHLAPDAKVLILEQESAIGYHSSGRSAALFEENYGKPSTVALNAASRAYHEGAGVLLPRGLLIVGTEAGQAAFDADVATMKMERIGLDQAFALWPILDPGSVTMAAYHGDAWDIDTDALLQGYLRTARSHGADLWTDAKVDSITRSDGAWTVQTGGRTATAPILVNAAGGWADQIAQMAGVQPVGLQPLRRSMARVAPPDGHDPARWPMLFGPGEDWYAKPDAGALLISPADEDPVDAHDVWAEDMVLAEGIARYQDHVTEPVTRMIANWAGMRTFAPDRNLVLGPDPQVEGFIWCAGQGGYGMQSSPAAGALTADLTLGRSPALPSEIVQAVTPSRF